MNAPPKLSIVEQIRARDGENCWLCDGKLDFHAKGNSRKAPTKEHLVPKSLGGSDELSNLALCHPGCNKQLGNRPLEEKLRMRAKHAANRARVAAKKAGGTPSPVPVPAPRPHPSVSPARKGQELQVQRLREQLRRWRVFALVSAGVALLAIGLAGGLLLAP